MTVLLVILIVLVVALCVALVLLARGTRRALDDLTARLARIQVAVEATPDTLVGKTVLVSTIGATGIRGIVHADLADRITLRESVVLTVGRDAEAPAQGLVHIGRERIDVVQELPAPAAIAED